MDKDYIEQKLMHLKNVRRIEAELLNLSENDIHERIDLLRNTTTSRWESCQRSFTALFALLNQGNPRPKDVFEIKLRQETIDDLLIETMARIQRSTDQKSYHVRPYAILGNNSVDQTLGEETFSTQYRYEFGTYHNQSAAVAIHYDGNQATMFLDRVNGRIVDELSNHHAAIFLSAIDEVVLPKISSSEETLIVLWDAVADPNLNPEYASKHMA